MEEQNFTDEQNSTEWKAPLPPEQIVDEREEPQMSEPATLGNIFFEPGRTFEDLRRKPRFLLAMLIILASITIFNVLFIQKIGFERLVRAQIESNSTIQQMSAEDREKIIQGQTGTFGKTIAYAAAPIVISVLFILGGLIYWLGANAMGGSASFLRGLSVWVYSSFPPTTVFIIANLIVLFIKSVDDIDLSTGQSGLIQANPAMFIDAKSSPVLAALLSGIDLFGIWGWILAAIGLQKVGKISSGAAWAVVLLIGLLGITMRVIGASLFR